MTKLSPLRISDPNLSETSKILARQEIVTKATGADFSNLFITDGLPEIVGQKNCENWLGSVSIPVGVAGPISILDENSREHQYYVPLATTEGALVASVSRGCKSISQAGGAEVIVRKNGMSRAPVFECQSGKQALAVLNFFTKNEKELAKVAEKTSGHLKYMSHQAWVRGRHIYVRLVFDTDQAMGMNMTTIATQAIADWLRSKFSDVKLLALSSNVCSDKKDNVINSLLGRGYFAQAEAVLSEKVVGEVLKTKIDKLVSTHIQKNLVGSNIAGSMSQNAQVANVLAGIYIATGQDPAHVVEGSKAFLSLNKVESGLYASLTLPNLNMGTIGGGTYLPAQKQAQQLIGGGKDIGAAELVSITAAACLAGELSLLASLSEHSLACAHQQLGRVNK